MVVGGGEDLAGFGFVLVVVVDVLDLVVGMEFLFDVCLDVCRVVIVEAGVGGRADCCLCVLFFTVSAFLLVRWVLNLLPNKSSKYSSSCHLPIAAISSQACYTDFITNVTPHKVVLISCIVTLIAL